ncbi:hypothetical protein BBJ28_00003718 [Nothophytophthora sp. Chile5]|nr:hypothetical protein BBJ28_00003718 [Nothophytophthora sp. Chile5]
MDADWEMVDTLEAMKSEGNQLFQQARFAEAVEVYTSILDKLAQVGAHEDEQAARRLEAAVRLNRAWARAAEMKLAQALRHCELSDSSTLDGGASAAANKAFALQEEAERAWRALQAEEVKLREVFEPSAKRTAATKGKSMKARKAKATRAKGINTKAEISKKTDDVWASLRQEEEATVAKAFSHSKRNRHELALEAS